MSGATGMVDSHCHLGDPAFDQDPLDVLERMTSAGVTRAIVVESDLDRLDATRNWVSRTPGLQLATGCHPHDADRWSRGLGERLTECWCGAAAAGEMGLDYHYDHSPRDTQRRVFSEQLALAVAQQMPIVVHAREADADVAAILREQPGAKVVLHSFSSGTVLLDAGLELGCWFSFSGMITFKSWHDDAAIRMVPDDRIMTETDAPYLAPVPHRGHRNEPAHVVEIVKRMAEARGTTVTEMVKLTSGNAAAFFRAEDPAVGIDSPESGPLPGGTTNPTTGRQQP